MPQFNAQPGTYVLCVALLALITLIGWVVRLVLTGKLVTGKQLAAVLDERDLWRDAALTLTKAQAIQADVSSNLTAVGHTANTVIGNLEVALRQQQGGRDATPPPSTGAG